MAKYMKFWSALLAGLVVAIPSLLAASNDGHISAQEWLTAVGLFVPAVAVALSPANALTDLQLVNQVLGNKNVDKILARLHVSSANLLRALQEGIDKVAVTPPPVTAPESPTADLRNPGTTATGSGNFIISDTTK